MRALFDGILRYAQRADVLGLLILCVCVALFLNRRVSSAAAGCLGCALFTLTGICDFDVAFSGFSSSIVLLMTGAMIVGIAMFRTGLAQIVGGRIVRLSRGSERTFLLASCAVCALLAMFLANTAILAAFIPIVESVCRTQPAMKRKKLLLPLACAVMFGGCCTLIGCTPQLTANGLLQKLAGVEMGMWTLTRPGICLLLLFFGYLCLFGYKDSERIWGREEEAAMDVPEEKVRTACEAAPQKGKIVVMAAIGAAMIASYAFSLLPAALTAIGAALLCVFTGCCTVKDIRRELNVETIAFLASCLGLGSGLTAAGTGEMIGRMAARALGGVHSAWALFALLTAVTLLISQFITNSTAVIVVLPIALSICAQFGYQPMPFCVGITLAASVACCTPLAAAQITMTQAAGYSFMDYLRYGLPVTLLSYMGVVAFVPLFYPLI